MNYKSKWYRPLTILACGLMLCGCGKKKSSMEVDHLAVRMESGENWSIIDADGKIVAQEEYATGDRISPIRNGIYWVKSGEGYSLYNVKDPKKPVSDKTWSRATDFVDDRAVVSTPGEPICIIDGSGKEVAKLGENVRRVYSYGSDGLAMFQDSEKGKLGYIDRSGKVAIAASYDEAVAFNEGLAVVVIGNEAKNEKTRTLIIDTNGKERGTINAERYQALSPRFSEGLLAVSYKDSDDKRIIYLNEKGEEELKVEKSSYRRQAVYDFMDGYAVFTNSEGNFGIIDKKGEAVVRAKYDKIINLGDDRFCANKNGKWGMIDHEDNTLMEFEYDSMEGIRLGGNYLVESGRFFCVVTPEGKSALKDEFNYYSFYRCEEYAEFINVKAAADAIAGYLKPDGYAGLRHGSTPADVAKTMGNPEPEKFKSYRFMGAPAEDPRLLDFSVSQDYVFTQSPVETKSHKENVKYGYWSYNKTVIDGYEYRNTPLMRVELTIRANNTDVDLEPMATIIKERLKAQGFAENEEAGNETVKVYRANVQGITVADDNRTYARVTVGMDNRRLRVIYFYPDIVSDTDK